MPREECVTIEPLLDDWVDGALTATEQGRVEAHLDVCSDCADHLTSLQDLLRRVDELPRSKAPASDLWAGIEPRLTRRTAVPRDTAAVGMGSRLFSRPSTRWPAFFQQAAAAVIFMALGGGISQILWPGGHVESETPAVALVEERDVESRGVDFAVAEADFLRAKESLWSAVYTSREATSPATREVVERNRRVIAGAIQELRAALATDPGNQQLEGMLLAQHRTEIDLLRRLARPTSARPAEVSTNI